MKEVKSLFAVKLIRTVSDTIVLLFACCIAGLNSCQTKQSRVKDFLSWLPEQHRDSVYSDPANPYSEEKRVLGRYLFYDNRLSANNTKACASCHAQEYSFTDNYTRSAGVYGDLHQRNSRPLINLVYNRYLTGADSTLHFPEAQMLLPLLNEHPPEMGVKGKEAHILSRLREDTRYPGLFAAAFPDAADPVSWEHIRQSIAVFVKTIISADAPWDRYLRDSSQYPLSAAAKRGRQLFYSPALQCYSCHAGINFSTPVLKEASGKTDFYFNTGLYNIGGKGGYPAADRGLYQLTGNVADEGKFRVPTLRNLAFTAPYYHDGSALSLADVIRVYERGGRLQPGGDGRSNPYKHELIKGFTLTAAEREDLISFLYSLSDTALIKNEQYANPFR